VPLAACLRIFRGLSSSRIPVQAPGGPGRGRPRAAAAGGSPAAASESERRSSFKLGVTAHRLALLGVGTAADAAAGHAAEEAGPPHPEAAIAQDSGSGDAGDGSSESDSTANSDTVSDGTASSCEHSSEGSGNSGSGGGSSTPGSDAEPPAPAQRTDGARRPRRPVLSPAQFAEALRRLAAAAFPKIANKATAWRLLMERSVLPLAARRGRLDDCAAALRTPGAAALLQAWRPQMEPLLRAAADLDAGEPGAAAGGQLHLSFRGLLALLQERGAVPQLLRPGDVEEALRRVQFGGRAEVLAGRAPAASPPTVQGCLIVRRGGAG
jgi:hypothetical protein